MFVVSPRSARPRGNANLTRVTSSASRGAGAGAHQVWNGSDSPIRVLMLSTHVTPDIVEYLDTGKVGGTSSVAGELIMFGRPGPEALTTGKARSSSKRSRNRAPGWASVRECHSKV